MSLYIVSIPIGNPDDITFRAIQTFKQVDFLICEELKNGRKLLKQLDIDKELLCLNEHNESSETERIVQHLLEGKHAALFSDCGTPLFADPGTLLVERCHQLGIRVVPVPGASSLLAALVMSGVSLNRFHYAGFLSRNSNDRRKEIRQLLSQSCPVVIYDAPYRLKPLLADLKQELPPSWLVSLALSLTKSDESFLYGSIDDILKQTGPHPPKKEFVLIISPPSPKKSKKHDKTKKKGKGRRVN